MDRLRWKFFAIAILALFVASGSATFAQDKPADSKAPEKAAAPAASPDQSTPAPATNPAATAPSDDKSPAASAQDKSPTTGSADRAADKASDKAEKVTDKAKNPGITADNQSEKKPDRDVTAQIRQSLMKDDTLSTSAHNVKVVTKNGMVTLKGPVRSEDEKKAVEAKAAEVAGAGNVKNDLVVSANAKDDKNAADRSKPKE